MFTVVELQEISKGVAVCIVFSFLLGSFFSVGLDFGSFLIKRLRKRNREEAAE